MWELTLLQIKEAVHTSADVNLLFDRLRLNDGVHGGPFSEYFILHSKLDLPK